MLGCQPGFQEGRPSPTCRSLSRWTHSTADVHWRTPALPHPVALRLARWLGCLAGGVSWTGAPARPLRWPEGSADRGAGGGAARSCRLPWLEKVSEARGAGADHEHEVVADGATHPGRGCWASAAGGGMGRLLGEAARGSAGGAAAWPPMSCVCKQGLCTCLQWLSWLADALLLSKTQICDSLIPSDSITASVGFRTAATQLAGMSARRVGLCGNCTGFHVCGGFTWLRQNLLTPRPALTCTRLTHHLSSQQLTFRAGAGPAPSTCTLLLPTCSRCAGPQLPSKPLSRQASQAA